MTKNSLLPIILLSIFSFSATGLGQETSGSSETDETFFASVAGSYIFSGNDDWDYAIGVDAKVGIYLTQNIRIFGLIGYSNWEVESEDLDLGFADLRIEGDAGIISAGGGVDFLVPVTDSSGLILTASVAYQFVSSNVDVSVETPFGSEKITVDIDDAAAVYVGADYFFAINKDLDVFFGGGYLFNVSEADITVEGADPEETGFEGATVRVGLQF